MENITTEITREEYEKLKAMTYTEQEKHLLPNGVPDHWAYGYGYYGHHIFERDGKFYKTFRIGSSCE